MHAQEPPNTSAGAAADVARRAFDICFACLGLILAGPVMGLVALALTIEGRGPVFHRSPRLGKGGRVFRLVRFRTMVDAAPDAPPEARLTRVGRFIRTYSLDDLPSLLHILRGDLSVVGPRPMEPNRVDLGDPTWRRILSVRPGYISYAILRLAAGYNAADPAERRRLELEYVQRRSLLLDQRVVWGAARALLASGGNIKLRGKPAS